MSKCFHREGASSSDVKVLLAHTMSDLGLSPHRVQYVAFAAIMLDTFRLGVIARSGSEHHKLVRVASDCQTRIVLVFQWRSSRFVIKQAQVICFLRLTFF
jgi:hypothetical protein